MLRSSTLFASVFACSLLAACQPGNLDLPGVSGSSKPTATKPQSSGPQNPALSANVNGEKIGAGSVRVALLLPLSAGGGGGIAGKQIANAAKLAMRDFGANRLQLVIKDTKGQASSAQSLTSEALAEGASLVLGPLFSANVSSASAITEPSNKPLIAFSSDTNRARAGVYLLSFAPQDDIARTLNFGIGQGGNRIVALLPQSAYGNLAERELQRVAAASGSTITAVARYKRETNSINEAARSVVQQLNESNGLYIPEGGTVPALLMKSLKAAGFKPNGHRIMGSGQWDTIDKRDPIFEGAVYAGADKSNFTAFASRYKASFGSEPSSTAALGYDAVSLSAELLRRSAVQPFTRQAIQSPSGFSGSTGLFRFLANGRLQRGLVVYQVRGGQAVVASPAPTSFAISR